MKGNHLIVETGRRGGIPIALAVCLFAVAAARGQEALRLSLAGDSAAQAERQAAETIGYYNLLAGPTAWRFSSGLTLEYDDNVRYSDKNPQSDFILEPNTVTAMHWPVTDRNSLDFTLGAGYSLYTQNPDLSRFYINPGSGLAFDIYAGDFVISLHDRVSLTENAYQNPAANGNNGNYSRLENAVGANTVWDLNEAVATLDVEHADYIGLYSNQQEPDGASENLLTTFGVHFVPEILAGVEAGGGLVTYQQSTSVISPNAKQWNAGGFFNAQISQYISARFDAGYSVFLPETGSTNFLSTDQGDFYFQFSISHVVNPFFNYSLSAGRSTDFEFYGQPYDHYFVRLQPNWNFLRKISISTPFGWENGTQVYDQSLNFDQFSGGITIRRGITKKLSGSFSYRFFQKISDQSVFNYTINIVSLNFSYQF